MGENEIPMLGLSALPRLSITTTVRSIISHLTGGTSPVVTKAAAGAGSGDL